MPSCLRGSAAVFALLCILAPAANAGPASDAVARFYANPGAEARPEMRRYFTDPARSVLALNDEAVKAGNKAGCIGHGLAVEDGRFDRGELSRTLELRENVQGSGAIVMAYYRVGGKKQAVEWTLEREGRSWLVADVMSLYGGWRLSDISCD